MSNHFLAIDNDLTYVELTLAAYLESAGVENKPFKDQYGNIREQPRSPDGRFGSRSGVGTSTTPENKTGKAITEEFLSGNIKPVADQVGRQIVNFFDLETDLPGISKVITSNLYKVGKEAAIAMGKELEKSDLARPMVNEIKKDEKVNPQKNKGVTLTGLTTALKDVGLLFVATTVAVVEKGLELNSLKSEVQLDESGKRVVVPKNIKTWKEAKQEASEQYARAWESERNSDYQKGLDAITGAIAHHYIAPLLMRVLPNYVEKQGEPPSEMQAEIEKMMKRMDAAILQWESERKADAADNALDVRDPKGDAPQKIAIPKELASRKGFIEKLNDYIAKVMSEKQGIASALSGLPKAVLEKQAAQIVSFK